jgi:DNA (cytosine-5)-methyltransferase 1
MLKVVELFSGIGSQTQALKNLGIKHRVIATSEIDQHAIKTYNNVHGYTYNMGDITKINKLPQCDLLTYSFPCTDLSIAGDQKGLSRMGTTRSGLLWEVERLLYGMETKPHYLVMENVPQVLTTFGKGFLDWCESLEFLGYKNYYKILNARHYGIPQNRERAFMVSIKGTDSFEFPKPVPLNTKLKDLLEKDPKKFYISDKLTEWLYSHARLKGSKVRLLNDQDVSSCLTATAETKTNLSCSFIKTDSGALRKLSPKECWRLTGFTDEQFALAKEVTSDSQLYKQAGNSIVVQVLEGIFREMFLQ